MSEVEDVVRRLILSSKDDALAIEKWEAIKAAVVTMRHLADRVEQLERPLRHGGLGWKD